MSTEAAQAVRIEQLEKFAKWVAGFNPTSGEFTFEMRVELQQRALDALHPPVTQ